MKLFLVTVLLSCLISISTPRYISNDFDLPQPSFDSFGDTYWNSRQTFQPGNTRQDIRDILRSQRSDRHGFPDDIFDEIRRQSSNRHRFPDDIMDDIRRQSSNRQRSPDDIMDELRRQSSYRHRSPDNIMDDIRRQSSNRQRSPADIFPQRRLQDVLDEIMSDFENYNKSVDEITAEIENQSDYFAGLDRTQRADMMCSHCTSRGYARCIINYCQSSFPPLHIS